MDVMPTVARFQPPAMTAMKNGGDSEVMRLLQWAFVPPGEVVVMGPR